VTTVPTFAQLRIMTDTDLEAAYDRAAQSVQVATQFYLDELNRRTQDRQTRAILRYTCWMTVMTFLVLLSTAVQLWLAVP